MLVHISDHCHNYMSEVQKPLQCALKLLTGVVIVAMLFWLLDSQEGTLSMLRCTCISVSDAVRAVS